MARKRASALGSIFLVEIYCLLQLHVCGAQNQSQRKLLGRRLAKSRGCDGKIVCRDMREYTGWGYPPGGVCDHGHRVSDNNCDAPCEGVREVSCRCESKEEAEEGNKSKTTTGFIYSALIIAGSICLGYYSWNRSRNLMPAQHRLAIEAQYVQYPAAQVQQVTGPQQVVMGSPVGGTAPVMQAPVMQAPVVQAGVVQAQVVGAGTGAAYENNPETNQNNATTTWDAPAQQPSGSPSDGPQKSTSRLEVAQERSAQVVRQNPGVYSLVKALVPLVCFGFGIWMIVNAVTKPRPFYENFFSMTSLSAGVGIIVSVILAMIKRLIEYGPAGFVKTNPGENPVMMVLTSIKIWMVVGPLVGLTGLIWSLVVQMSPGIIYHNKCGEWDN